MSWGACRTFIYTKDNYIVILCFLSLVQDGLVTGGAVEATLLVNGALVSATVERQLE